MGSSQSKLSMGSRRGTMPEEESKKREHSEEEEVASGAEEVAKPEKKKKKKKNESSEDEDSGVGSEVEDVSDASGDHDLDTSNIIESTRGRSSRRSAQAAQEIIAKKNPTFTDESEEDSD